MAPSQYTHTRLAVLVAQPTPDPPPGEGGEKGKGLGRNPVTVVVRPTPQHKVESVQQGGEVLVCRSARCITYLCLDRREGGSGRERVYETLGGASLLVTLNVHPQEVEALVNVDDSRLLF